MKRGGPLKRTGGLKRTGSLKTTKRLRARPKPPVPELDRELDRRAQLTFYEVGLAVCARDRRRHYVCPVCQQPFKRSQMQVHHIITKEQIKRYVSSLRLREPELSVVLRARLWDPRDALALCTDCHTRHTLAEFRVPISLVSNDAWEFAVEIESDHLIERYYHAV